MKTNLLLPYGFKKVGWIVFIPTFILGCGIVFFNTDFSLPLSEAVTTNIAIIGTVLGALMIGFSREKIEDEMIQKIRLDALMVAVWINYLLLIVLSLALYDLQFLFVLSANTAATLVIFLAVFRYKLWQLKRDPDQSESEPSKPI